MTFLAGLGSRIGDLAAQRAVQVAAAGLLSGAVAGSVVVASGLSPFDGKQTSATMAIFACPGSGSELAHVSGGQTLLVTARSLDGHWLEVYVGEPGIDRGWAQASALRLQTAPGGLPVGSCVAIASEPSSAPSPSPAPSPSIVATVGPSPTARPTLPPGQTATPTLRATPTAHPTPKPTPKRTPKPSPAPTVDPNPPQLSGMQSQFACIGSGGASQISVTVNDPDGDLSTVTIGITPPGQFGTLHSMTHPIGSNAWRYTIATTGFSSDGYVHYVVTARDTEGNSVSQASTDAPWVTATGNSLYYMGGGCLF